MWKRLFYLYAFECIQQCMIQGSVCSERQKSCTDQTEDTNIVLSWCSAPTEFRAMQGGFKNILALTNAAVKFSDIS